MLKRDNLRFGLLLGLLIPIVGSFIYYFIQFRHVATIKEYAWYVLREKSLMTAMLSVLVVANIAVFTYYINSRKDRTAKGVFIATCIYGIASLIWKFIL